VSDPNSANDTASDTDVVLANIADLSVAKDDGVATVTAGDGVTRTYTITITNNGPSQAVSVNLSDSWPSGFTRGNTTSSSGTCTSGTGNFTCSLGNILPGASATVTADYTVPATTPAGTQTNTASVTTSSTDPDSTNNSAIDIDTVMAANADLSVTKNDFTTTVMAGDSVIHTYTILVTNNGPSEATGVTLNDTWPTGFTRGATSPSCTSGTGNFTCSLGTLAPGASATVTANYTVPATTLAGPQTNTVNVSSNTPDNNAANNSASDTDTVTPVPTTSADLSITKTDSPDPVNAGAPLTYTLTVNNSGPDSAINLTVTDTLPAGETFVSASGSGWVCTQSGGTVTCTDPTLASGATTVITINVTAPDNPGTVVNQATVTSDTNDPNSSNNTATASTTVVAPAAKWTGGGQINVNGGTANFGFNVERKTQNGSVKGHLEFHNHVNGLHVHSIAITSLKVIGNKAIFKGTVDESTNGGPKSGPYNFTVTVQDVDQGRNDKFEIQISDPNGTHEGSSVTPIRHGNIEQH
jgi:uncharacterized repeat protein (TIGR01451 family)